MRLRHAMFISALGIVCCILSSCEARQSEDLSRRYDAWETKSGWIRKYQLGDGHTCYVYTSSQKGGISCVRSDRSGDDGSRPVEKRNINNLDTNSRREFSDSGRI